MKHITRILAITVLSLPFLHSCNDSSTIGSSIVQNQITVTIDSSFTVTGKTVDIERVQSRTTAQLLGRIDAQGFGRLSSDVVTQFMPASQLDTAHIRLERIDSLMLTMAVASGEYLGDSVAPLGIDVYPLTKLLPSPIFSDFNPEDYYDADNLLASKMYNVSTHTTGVITSDGTNVIQIKLPIELGRKLYAAYRDNPSYFASPTSFASLFPGLYLKNSYGSGRITRVSSTVLSMYYHYNYYGDNAEKDSTIVGVGNYFAVTPEIITNNNISLEVSPEIEKRVADGEHIVMAPVGKEVEMRFPAPEILAAYNSAGSNVKVFNTLTFSLPAEAIENDCGLNPPTYLLMVLKKKKDEFFDANTLPDNITSFYAKYDGTNGVYDFGDMRSYIMKLLEQESIDESDYTFTLTPVSAAFETNSSSSSYYSYYYSPTTETLVMMTPYVASPVMARLKLNQALIVLSFSSQSVNQ